LAASFRRFSPISFWEFYRINERAKCKSMSIEVWQEWWCNAQHDRQAHGSPTLTPKQTIRTGASCRRGNK
jgi:hypothetical protein